MSGPPRPPREIALVAVGPLAAEAELFAWLAEVLGAWTGAPVSRGEPLEPRDEWWEAERGQLNSNRVVDALIDRDAPGDDDPPDRWTLALTEADLYAPGLSFVFGEAAQGGAWAVVGLARLREGPGADAEARLRRRVLVEAVHELGHVAGLEHCTAPACVMFPSETLADTDRKSAAPCPRCAEALRACAGLDRSPSSR